MLSRYARSTTGSTKRSVHLSWRSQPGSKEDGARCESGTGWMAVSITRSAKALNRRLGWLEPEAHQDHRGEDHEEADQLQDGDHLGAPQRGVELRCRRPVGVHRRGRE